MMSEEGGGCRDCCRLQSRLERALRQLERQLQFGEELRVENEALKQQLQDLRQAAKKPLPGARDAAVQTEGEATPQEAPVGDPELEAAAAGGEGAEVSVADLLRNTANACINQNGYVYDEKSGLYYDYNSGYYYDPHSKLFYEPRSRTYYAYDEEKREYRLHSRESADHLRRHCEDLFVRSGGQHAPPKKKAKKNRIPEPAREEKKEERKEEESTPFIGPVFVDASKKEEESVKVQEEKEEKKEVEEEEEEGEEKEEEEEEEDVEEGEITSESESAQDSPKTEEREAEEEEEEEEEEEDEEGEEYAPCVRLMVLSSPTLTTGSLFIVTCSGGTIGRPSSRYKHVVTLEDTTARERHCIISYDQHTGSYSIRDTKRKGNTCVNGERAFDGDSLALRHGDRLCLADTEMAVHIHPGNDTCDDCEPGVAKAVAKAAEEGDAASLGLSLEEQRREEAKRLKSKFGLRGVGFAPVRVRGRDRAAERRREVGSAMPESAARAEPPASAHTHIPDSNKGAQMLAKMGWKKGQALGRSGSGIVEPVTAELRSDPQAGLGSSQPALSLDAASSSSAMARARHVLKMRARFAKLEAEGE